MKYKKNNYDKAKLKKLFEEQFPERSPEEEKKALEEHERWYEENFLDNPEKKLKRDFLKLLEIARENINMDAMYIVADSYFNGTGVRANNVEAIYWIMKSELLGHPDAPELRKQIEQKASELQIAAAVQRLKEESPK